MAHPDPLARLPGKSNRSRLLGITAASAIIAASVDGYLASTAAAIAVAVTGGVAAAYLLVRSGEQLRYASRAGGLVAVFAYVLSFPAILLIALVSLIVLALFGHSI
jgi:hypothetical protein